MGRSRVVLARRVWRSRAGSMMLASAPAVGITSAAPPSVALAIAASTAAHIAAAPSSVIVVWSTPRITVPTATLHPIRMPISSTTHAASGSRSPTIAKTGPASAGGASSTRNGTTPMDTTPDTFPTVNSIALGGRCWASWWERLSPPPLLNHIGSAAAAVASGDGAAGAITR